MGRQDDFAPTCPWNDGVKWSCTQTDAYIANYQEEVSPYPNAAFEHNATISGDVTIELVEDEDARTVRTLTVTSATLRNGEISARTYHLYQSDTQPVTFENVTLGGNQDTPTSMADIYPNEDNGTLVLKGTNEIKSSARLRGNAKKNLTYVICDGMTKSDDSTFTLWRNMDLKVPYDVNLVITNATLGVKNFSSSMTNSASGGLYNQGLVDGQFTCTIYTDAAMLGESSPTVNVGATKYYVTLTAKENGNFTGTTGTAAPWTLDCVRYEFAGSGEKTWREDFWTVAKPAGYIAAAEQAYPNSADGLRGQWASLTSQNGSPTVEVVGENYVDELQLHNGDVTIVGDRNSSDDKIAAHSLNFRDGTADKRVTYVLRDVEIDGGTDDRFNLNDKYTTVIVEGTNVVYSACLWQFSGNNGPMRIGRVFRNGATTLGRNLYCLVI